MARRKSVYVKWTLVFLLVFICPFALSRPQDTPTISTSEHSLQTDKSTDNPLRYKLSNNLTSTKLPIVIGFINSSLNLSRLGNQIKDQNNSSNYKSYFDSNVDKTTNSTNRRSRLLTKTVIKGNNNNYRTKKPNKVINNNKLNSEELFLSSRKPTIRKVITKWSDKTKYEDLNFSTESSKSTDKEGDTVTFSNSLSLEDYSSTENTIEQSHPTEKRPRPYYPHNVYNNNIDNNKKYRPNEFESEEQNLGVIHSNKVHIIQYPFPSVSPSYIFTTPTPTPIITNLGDPKPWPPPNKYVNRKPTSKPVRKKPSIDQYNHHSGVHNNYPQYSDNNFEITTFQPHNAYTERIVIRPEEYSASDDCPTVFLTLNNTFQGQGKEACPDLNIAVNTNVVNKNVVVDSEEEDSLFPAEFGLGEDSEGDEAAAATDYFESDESPDPEEGESASVEAQGLSNYHHAPIQSDSPGHGQGGSHNAAISGGKPGKPNKEDDFTLSSVISFFKPAINAMSWLAAISPFSFSVLSILLTPITLLLAGYSGVAALFAPLGLARESSPKIVHIYRPKWEWDDKYKTWYLNSFPENRRWRPPRLPRNSKEDVSDDIRASSVKPTLFFKVKEWMKELTKTLRVKASKQEIRKIKRKKRETWTRRVK